MVIIFHSFWYIITIKNKLLTVENIEPVETNESDEPWISSSSLVIGLNCTPLPAVVRVGVDVKQVDWPWIWFEFEFGNNNEGEINLVGDVGWDSGSTDLLLLPLRTEFDRDNCDVFEDWDFDWDWLDWEGWVDNDDDESLKRIEAELGLDCFDKK